MKVLLAGGTGFIGQKLGQALVKAGYDVLVVTRGVSKSKMAYPCELLSWKELGGVHVDVVINLAGANINQPWSKNAKAEIWKSRVDSSQKILSGLSQNPKIWINASAIGYYGSSLDEEKLETSSPSCQKNDFLSELCVAWENSVPQTAEFRSVIFRIGLVLGKGGGALKAILPPARNGYGSALGSGHQWMSWIAIEDLVALFVWALENDHVRGVYNAVAPGVITNREFMKSLCHQLGRWCLPMAVPAFVLRILLGSRASLVLGSQKVSASKILSQGFEFQFSNLNQVWKHLFPKS